MKYHFLLVAIFSLYNLAAQPITGRWMTVDDNTGEKKSVVEIYAKDGKYFGKIVRLFRQPNEDPDPSCEECMDYRKNQKIIGMDIITDMKSTDDGLEGGEIMDPENGNIYKCRIWIEDGHLKVRGYLYFLYRTQTWLPVD